MELRVSLILLLFCLKSCVSHEQKLRKISTRYVIESLRKGESTFKGFPYRSSDGQDLSTELRNKLNSGRLVRNFYINKDYTYGEIRLVSATIDNIVDDIIITNLLASNPVKNLGVSNSFDCTKKDSIIKELRFRDQFDRGKISAHFEKFKEIQNANEHNSMLEYLKKFKVKDNSNLNEVISMIQTCGWPSDKKNIETCWFIINHSKIDHIVYFFYDFVDMANSNLLDRKWLAASEDRILISGGYPQKYGCGFAGSAKDGFHPILNVSKLEERRKQMEMISIEQYANEKGAMFSIEDHTGYENYFNE